MARPQPLGDLLRVTLDGAGLDSALRAYRALRQQYYGRSSYDFGEGTLNALGVQLGRDRRLKEAMAFLDVNAEFFPGVPSVPFSKGEAYLAAGDTTSALTAYRLALAADSTFRPARDRLRRLGGGRAPR